ncbi:MAG: zinc metalloprotease [Saprospiraceae bacterium]
MEVLSKNLQENPRLSKIKEKIDQQTQRSIRVSNSKRSFQGVITIPVVVHVVYKDSIQNISNAQILSQIDVLNEDFRRLNDDADNLWPQADDIEIEFCLATLGPNGESTLGFTKTLTNRVSFSTTDRVKSNSTGGKTGWPSDQYLNIWVCNLSGTTLGYAQFPGGGLPATDGVVIDYQYFGTTGTVQSPFDLGRTTTHEVGHWLNLRHIWGDGDCDFDDFITDTPLADEENYFCDVGHVSCGNVNMVQNYMDYSDDVCMNLFTNGQKKWMRALFEVGGYRQNLLYSNGCGIPESITCNDGIQNGNELGIDCGGNACQPCTNCKTFSVTIHMDDYPEETYWNVVNENDEIVMMGGRYGSPLAGDSSVVKSCLPYGIYTFHIFDDYDDGLCCGGGIGDYQIGVKDGFYSDGGGVFTTTESKTFLVTNTFTFIGPGQNYEDPNNWFYNLKPTLNSVSLKIFNSDCVIPLAPVQILKGTVQINPGVDLRFE